MMRSEWGQLFTSLFFNIEFTLNYKGVNIHGGLVYNDARFRIFKQCLNP